MTQTLLERPAALAPAPAESGGRREAAVLAIIIVSYLMIILDASVVITALPEIRADLGFSPSGLSWVQNAYTLAFGGLLLLGARAGDILGRRRTFMFGTALFTGASIVAGLAQSEAWLLVARAAQGVGAAVAAPATLALLMTAFPPGAGRVKALSLYSAAAAAGGSIGLILGGALTTLVSWRLSMFINAPVGALLLWATPRFLPATPGQPGHFDALGAITSTLGMTTLVYGFVSAGERGWGQTETVASFAAAVVLLTGFFLWEHRATHPITPLRLFNSRQRSGAYLTRMLVVSGMFAMFFFVSQYLQLVRGLTSLGAGLVFLPTTALIAIVSQLMPRFMPDIAPRRLVAIGIALDLVGMAWLSQLGTDTSFFPGITGPLMILGVGMGLAFAPMTGLGMVDVAAEDTGAASGLVNAAHQLGGSVGLGIMVSIYTSRLAGQGGGSATAADVTHDIGTVLSGSTIFFALALTVVLTVMEPRLRPRRRTAVAEA